MRIFVSGSLAYDRIMTFPGKFSDHILPDKIHILNVCFLVDGLDEKFGGTAGNIAYSLALLEEKPVILSAGGKDFGPYREWLERIGLPLGGIRVVKDEFTAGAYITTDQSDNQITGFNPGAMKHACGYEFGSFRASECLGIISPGNLDDMMNLPRFFRDKGIRYIFDPGQQIPAFNGDQLVDAIKGSHILITNDYELEMIMKATGLDKAEVLDLTDCMITTLGEEGSRVLRKGKVTDIPVAVVSQVLDPTGAGDAYRSGLIKGLAMGRSIEDSALMGAVCSAYAVERKGTQEHGFTFDEFRARYRDNFGDL